MKLILYFSILICFFISCQNKELPTKYLSNISVVRETTTSPKVSIPVSTPENHLVAMPKKTPQKELNYHVIVSSFGTAEKAQAEKLVSQLKAQNYPATLLYSSQRYRVSIEGFATESEANAARDKYRKITNRQDAWVYKME